MSDSDSKKRTALREELKKSLDESQWIWLAPHLARDSVILVAAELDLLAVAERIALDDQVQVGEWIAKGLLNKPSRAQIESWTKTPEKKFLTAIVQPYVLAQEHQVH